MQASGGEPDHKAFWVKKQLPKKCFATKMPRCPQICSLLSLPRLCSFLLSVGFRVQVPVMQICLVAIYQTVLDAQCVKFNHGSAVLSEHIAIHSNFNKSIHHISVYTALYSYSVIQSTPTCLCPLSQRKTHLFECKTTPHSNAITMGSSHPPLAKILTFHYSLVFFGKRFHIYGIFPSNFSSDICLCQP